MKKNHGPFAVHIEKQINVLKIRKINTTLKEDKTAEEAYIAYLTGEPGAEWKPGSDKTEELAGLEKAWELSGTAYSYQNSQPDRAWAQLDEKLKSEPKTIRLAPVRYLRYAAVVVGIAVLASVTLLLTRHHDEISNPMVTNLPAVKTIRTEAKPSALTTLQLPDGTTVKLNANSTLQYPEQFAANERRVKLSGEAYFEVLHDAAHPFVVEMEQAIVEDLGTSFNISAYPGRRQVEVNVTAGSVRLRDKAEKETAVLTAGSNGKFQTESGKIVVANELSPNFMSWITRKISFRHTLLATVFDELENVYHVRITCSDPRIADIAYTANFEKSELDDIVRVIAGTHHLVVTKQADGYLFAYK